MSVFRLTMLPASEGDSLILSYGPDEAAGSLRHVVIDGGRKKTWPQLLAALTALAAREQERLINWGYAVSDAGIRRYWDATIARPGAFPYPLTGIG